MLLLLDNYDSFTYNLAHYLELCGAEVRVVRNDQLPVSGLLALRPSHIIVSPGPGTPAEAGVSNALIRAAAGVIPVLGVCLGHQCMAEVFGGRVIPAALPMHGKTSAIMHDGAPPFTGLPSPFTAMRYHSLVVDPASVPPVLEITARTADGVIMGLRHRELSLVGVQFHPESILTDHGLALLQNFLALSGGRWHD